MRRTYLTLSEEDKDYLKTLSKKRTIQAQIVDRAKILLYKSDGMTFNDIAEKLAVSSLLGLEIIKERVHNGRCKCNTQNFQKFKI